MSLRSRIVLAVTAVFAGVSLLAGWLMLDRAEKSLRTAFDRTLQTRADWLLSLVSVDPVVLPLPTDRERMLVRYQTYGHWRELFRSPGFPNTFRQSRHHPSFSYSYRSVTSQTTSNQLPDGQLLLTLAVPDANLQQDTHRLRWLFGLGWLMSLLLAFGAGYGVAGWLLRPIQRIVEQANSISSTSNSSRIQLPGNRDELYQLTDTLNQMLARIQENVDLQRNFFGAAAHELRTPLTIMKTGLEVTLGQNQADAATNAFLSGQLDEVSRLARLIDEFLELSRPEALMQPLKLTEVHLATLLTNCLAQLRVIAADYEVTTQLDWPATTDDCVQTDAVKLEHILLNLIENAIKYAVAGSAVSIRLQRTETSWQIDIQNRTVRESGPTLDLTQAYFRADPLKEGHGLGLWIGFRLTTLVRGELMLSWQDFTFTSSLILPIALQE